MKNEPDKVEEMLRILRKFGNSHLFGSRKEDLYFGTWDVECALEELVRLRKSCRQLPFDSARQEYVNTVELKGGELPLPGTDTPEALADHCMKIIGSFWDWPGNEYSNAELIYRVTLGALRHLQNLKPKS